MCEIERESVCVDGNLPKVEAETWLHFCRLQNALAPSSVPLRTVEKHCGQIKKKHTTLLLFTASKRAGAHAHAVFPVSAVDGHMCA